MASPETLPFAWYGDPAVLAAEQEHIFRRFWQYVGHTGQLTEPGSMIAARAGDVPVLVVRGGDDRLRAFLNVCRHRGARLVDGEACRATIQCPYHAWTYDLDGALLAAPRSERESGFRPDDHSLRPLSVDTWGPFVFVNPDDGATPLAESLGPLPEQVAAVGVDVDSLHFQVRVESSYDANWKICCENFLECYHCQVAHPGVVEVIDVSPDAYGLEASGLVSSQFGPVRHDWTGEFDPRGSIGRGQFHFMFPNLTLNVSPGHPNVSIGPITPAGLQRADRFLDYFFAPDTPSEWIDSMLAWDDQVGVEDTALVERVQAGVRSGLLERGVLFESEKLIGHFDALVRQALADG